MIQAGFFYYLLLFIPFFVFYDLFKKHFKDKNLSRGFWLSVPVGIITVFIVRMVYFLINFLLGFELSSFISGNHNWFIVLAVNICVVGFIEELFKAIGVTFSSLFCEKGSGSAAIFMNFAGCAMGFAFMENLYYFNTFGSSIILSRIVASNIAHLMFASICAITSGLSRVKSSKLFMVAKQNKQSQNTFLRSHAASLYISIGIFIGIACSAVIHGLFNFFLFYYNIEAFSGILLSILSIFVLFIYNFWVTALRIDLPEYMFISSCPQCGSVSFMPFRFCSACGARVKILRKFMFVVQEMPVSKQNSDGQENKSINNIDK